MLKIKLPNLVAKNPAASQVAPEIQGASRSDLRQARVAVFGDVSLVSGHRRGKGMDGSESAREKEPEQRKKGRDDPEARKLGQAHPEGDSAGGRADKDADQPDRKRGG